MIVLGKEVRTNDGDVDIVGLRVVSPEIVGEFELEGEIDVEFDVGSVVVGKVGSDDTLTDGAIDGCVAVVGDDVAVVGDNVPLIVEGTVGDNVVPFVEETVGAPVGALVSPGKTILLVQ